MAGYIYDDVKITGIACALPTKNVKTDEYEKYFGKKVIDDFKKTTGIESRFLLNGKQTASDLCYVAAKELLNNKGLSGEDIDALIFITQYPDYKTPSTAFVLHKRLKIKKECMAFDINLGCSGFVIGISLLSGLIHSGMLHRALLLVGDADSSHPVTEDHSLSMMFGDAGSACILEKGSGQISGLFKSDGEGYNVLISPRPGARFTNEKPEASLLDNRQMSGEDTFLFTIKEVPKLFKQYFKTFNCTLDDYDYCVLHQANLFILNHIAKRIKLPKEKMPVSIDKYGNTDGASIPLGIVDLCEKLDTDKELKLLVSGFGIGLSWGVAGFTIKVQDVLPVIFTDEYFEEGFHV